MQRMGILLVLKTFPSFATLARYRSDAQLQADILLDDGGYNQLLLQEQ